MKQIYDIYYSGGSGGFFFYEGLCKLLGYDLQLKWTKKYENWKTCEIINITIPIKLICNDFENISNNSILIYTDFSLQYKLAELKNAHWFNDNYIKSNIDNIAIDMYNNVKDTSWLEITNILDFNNLDNRIKNELINDFKFPSNISNKNEWIKFIIYKDDYHPSGLNRQIFNILNKFKYKFKLQEIIQTKFKCVCNKLELGYTVEIENYVDMWVNLHPPEIQRLFYE